MISSSSSPSPSASSSAVAPRTLAALRHTLHGNGPEGRHTAVSDPAAVALTSVDPERLVIDQGRRDRALQQARRTVQAAEAVRAPVTLLGIGQTPFRPRLHAGSGSHWVLLRMEDDPLYQTGAFPIPRSARRRLTRLNRSDAHFDSLIVAHEIPPSLAPSLLSISPDAGPVELDPAVLPKLISHPGPARSTRRFAATAGEIAGTIGAAAVVAGAAVAAAPALLAGAVLDPVIFGAQNLDGAGRAAVIYELVRWEW